MSRRARRRAEHLAWYRDIYQAIRIWKGHNT